MTNLVMTTIMTATISNILNDLKQLAERPMTEAHAMPKAMYTDERITSLEVEQLFLTEWICAGRSDKIPHSGDYMSFDLCHQPLILTRQDDDTIRAISNICRHRMMRLVTGHGNAKQFTCPYHAWTYRNDGSLMAAPYMDKTACFDKGELSLPAVRCEDYQGWIYVTLNNNLPPVADMLTRLTDLTERYQMAAYQTIFHEEHIWDTNWKCLTDNFMESYHLPMAHQHTVGTHFVVDETAFTHDNDDEHFTYQCFTKADGAFVGTAHPSNTHLTGKWRNVSVMPTVFPAHMYVLAPDHLWYLCLQPHGTGQVKIKYGAALAPEVLAHCDDRDQLIGAVKAFLDQVQDEDKHVVEGIYQGAKAPLSQSGPLSWLEKENHDFTRYLSKRLTA